MSNNIELFVRAINIGLSNATDYRKSKLEALKLISDANQAIEGMLKKKNTLMYVSGENWEIRGSSFIQSLKFVGHNDCYPILIKTHKHSYEAHSFEELKDEVRKILSSTEFGLYIR